MTFFARCISGNSLKGMVRGEADEDDAGYSGSSTPNDTAHGGSKLSSYSWKRLSAKSRSALNSPKKPSTPPSSAASNDGNGPLPASMEPVMERTISALTDLEAVKFLVEDWSHKCWRPATPQDQGLFDRLEESDIQPLVALGEGAYGSVNLCRITANSPRNPRHCRSASAAATFPDTTTEAASSSSPFASLQGAQAKSKSSDLHITSTSASGATVAAATDPNRSAGISGRSSPPPCNPNADLTPAAAAAATDAARRCNSGGTDGTASSETSASAFAASSQAAMAASAEFSSGDAALAPAPAADPDAGAPMQPASSLDDPQLIVAVKRVPLGWNQERELMQLHRCQQCPFIVRLFGFVDDGTEHCNYVMEWAEGGDLGAVLASLKDRRGANKARLLMSEASARYYCGCLLLALDFLHASGLLHRDVKPSNLLLTSDGTAKLADLGFTVALDANGRSVGCCGTVGYIAPEVYSYGTAKSRLSYGVPADIWSAGATLYQILTGQVVTDKHEEVLKKGWRPPTHPRFSHALQDLLNRMLAPKPTARPQSAASVMRHAWFSGFDWQALRSGRMKAPYVPSERRRMRQVAEDVMAPDASGARGRLSGSGGGSGRGSSSGGDGPPTASPGGQRLPTVVESDFAVQRSALSGRDEGSVKRGREGLVREGSSFETALGTVSPAEAPRASAGGSAVPDAAAAAAPAEVVAAGRDPGHVGVHQGQEHGHAHGHGLTVRFAVGVAECA